ncbi:MAG: tetratricopeptide repeat protein [Gemmatimonadaceae bacterium]|nr:tetratricopeptide repeat protein [Gemmatimonadaceae bacterium]
MVALITLVGLTAMIAVTRSVPTAPEMQATFADAQRFYASGAYDQAIEAYQHIIRSRSRFLQMKDVEVTVGEISAPLQEVALYQTGNAHFKSAEEALASADRSRDPARRSRYQDRARSLFGEAADAFVRTEELSTVAALKALARSRAVACWYAIQDYERTIEGAALLIERYPSSAYVEQAMYDVGWAHYDKEDYRNSIAAFERLVERFPGGYRGSRALFQIGEAHFALENYREAVPFYQRLVDSQRIEEMSEREILQMKRQKIAGLVDETALDLAAKALIRVGECHEKTGQYAQAEEAFQLVASRFAEEQRLAEEAYLRQADMHYRRGDFAAVVAVYHQAIEATDDVVQKARMQLLLANRYFETGHYEEAVREYEVYRANYEAAAARAGLAVEGVALQIARAWFRVAERQPEEERLDYYRRAESELRATLAAYPGSPYDVELRFNLGLAIQLQDQPDKMAEALVFLGSVAEAPNAEGYRQSALFQIARIHHGRGDHAMAAETYRTVIDELAEKPEQDVARFELGIVEREAGNQERALRELLAVGREAELFARSRLEAGQLLVQQGEHRQAVAVLQEGLEARGRPEGQALHYLLASASMELGEQEGALTHFAAVIDQGDPDLGQRAAYSRGSLLFRMKRYSEALEELNREWTDPELSSAARRLLAASYANLGDYGRAQATYRQMADAAAGPLERAEHLLAEAEIANRQGRYADAFAACEEILGLDLKEGPLPEERPYHLREKAWFLQAESAVRTEDFARAFDRAEAGLRAFPRGFFAADLLFLRGLAALQTDRAALAAASFGRMLAEYPGHPNAGYARYYLGYAHFNEARFSRAIPFFAGVVDQYPDLDVAADALFRLAESRYNSGAYGEARQTYRQVVRRYPETGLAEEALYNIAWCLLNEAPAEPSAEHQAAVRQAMEEYLTRYPGGRHLPTARYTLAEMSYNAGDYDRAYELFQGLQADFPESEAARQAEGVLQDVQEAVAFRDYSGAMEAFNRALAEDDRDLIRQAIGPLEAVWRQYPMTSSGLAAKMNVGVCHQQLGEWQKAVDAFSDVITQGERGNAQVTPRMMEFCERRRLTIERKHL